MSHIDKPNDPALLQRWRDWLLGNCSTLPIPHQTKMGKPFARRRDEVELELAHCLHSDPVLGDWLIPADRYDSGTPGAPYLGTHEFSAVVRYGCELHLRGIYVSVLKLLGATVDHHGWVLALAKPQETSAWQLPSLSAHQVRLLARILRMLHLAGWRGYSRSNYQDPLGYWYDLGLQSWLLTQWREQCPHQVFPQEWTLALDKFSLPGPVPDGALRPRQYSFGHRDDHSWERQRTHRTTGLDTLG